MVSIVRQQAEQNPVSSAIVEQENSAIVLQKNTRAVAHAVAQQELEGLHVSPATLNDMRRAALGEIEPEEVIRNIYARFGHVPIFQP